MSDNEKYVAVPEWLWKQIVGSVDSYISHIEHDNDAFTMMAVNSWRKRIDDEIIFVSRPKDVSYIVKSICTHKVSAEDDRLWGRNKLQAIKALRLITGKGLKESKDTIEAIPYNEHMDVYMTYDFQHAANLASRLKYYGYSSHVVSSDGTVFEVDALPN